MPHLHRAAGHDSLRHGDVLLLGRVHPDDFIRLLGLLAALLDVQRLDALEALAHVRLDGERVARLPQDPELVMQAVMQGVMQGVMHDAMHDAMRYARHYGMRYVMHNVMHYVMHYVMRYVMRRAWPRISRRSCNALCNALCKALCKAPSRSPLAFSTLL